MEFSFSKAVGISSLTPSKPLFPQLHTLSLSSNSLSSLPLSFASLTSLTSLSLQKNAFTETPAALQLLPSLKLVDLSLNPLSDPPHLFVMCPIVPQIFLQKSVDEQPYDFAESLFDSARGKIESRRLCVMIIGRKGIGKHSIHQQLRKQLRKLQEKSAYFSGSKLVGRENQDSRGHFDNFSYHWKKSGSQHGENVEEEYSMHFNILSTSSSDDDGSYLRMLLAPLSCDSLPDIIRMASCPKRLDNPKPFFSPSGCSLQISQHPYSSSPLSATHSLSSSTPERFPRSLFIGSQGANFTSVKPAPTSPHRQKSHVVPQVIMLVFNSLKLVQESQRLIRSLDLIQKLSPNATVFLIGTHLDLWPSSYSKRDIRNIFSGWTNRNCRNIIQKFPRPVTLDVVNSVTGDGLTGVCEMLYNQLIRAPAHSIPRSFSIFESYLLSLRRVTPIPLLSIQNIVALSAQGSVPSTYISSLIEFLILSGTVGYVPNFKKKEQNEFVVTDLRAVIEYHEMFIFSFDAHGVSTHSVTRKNFQTSHDIRFPLSKYEAALELLLWSEALLPMWNGSFLLSSRLPPTVSPSEFDKYWPADKAFQTIRSRHFCCASPFFDVIPRILSKAMENVRWVIGGYWSFGCFVKHKDDEFFSLVICHPNELILIAPESISSRNIGGPSSSSSFSYHSSTTQEHLNSSSITFVTLILAIESLLKDSKGLIVAQKTICPHCFTQFQYREEMLALIQSLSSISTNRLRNDEALDRSNLEPLSAIQNRLISLSQPELFFDLENIKPIKMLDSQFVECAAGAMVDILDLIPEYSVPKDLEAQGFSIRIGDQISKGLDTEIYHAIFTSNVNAADSFSIPLPSFPNNVNQNVVFKQSCQEMAASSSEFRKDQISFQHSDRSLYREMLILARLKHKNIVELRGVVMRPLGLVIEYMEGGSLLDYLRHCRVGSRGSEERNSGRMAEENADKNTSRTEQLVENPLESVCELPYWTEKMKIACEIAEAMTFLHSNMFIHRDLKSPNILLTKSPGSEFFTAKVSDFGTCASLEFTNEFGGSSVDNPRWLPPEIINRSTYTTKADVYPFGIIVNQ
jgi:Leucine-rich repeat (LRR) protein